MRNDGLDIISAHYVQNLRTVELKPWPRRGTGAKGVYINHEASRFSNDCYVCEIAPGQKLAPIHHLYEEMLLILSGRGSTTVWNNAGARITFEWKEGAIFAIPLNCSYQHFNGSGRDVVRFVAVTNAPTVINRYDDLNFIFNCPYDFKNRFSGEPDYFSAKGEQDGFLLRTNFVPDAVNLPLITARERGAGGGHIRFNMARGTIASHISQFPIGTYKKAHAHGPGAHVIILSGEGYSLMWPEGEEPQRFEWQEMCIRDRALAVGVAVPALAAAGAAVAAGIPVWASRPVSPPAQSSAACWRRPTVTAATIRTAMASRPVMAMAARPFTATVTATATVAVAVIPRKCGGRTVLTSSRSASEIWDQLV